MKNQDKLSIPAEILNASTKKGLTKIQLEYMQTRVREIVRNKRYAIEEKYTTPEVSITCQQRAKAFAKGEYIIKKEYLNKINAYDDIVDVCQFNAEQEESVDQKAIDRAMKPIDDFAEQVMDHLMLGEHLKALEMLQQLASM